MATPVFNLQTNKQNKKKQKKKEEEENNGALASIF
jgi:hypothetical protein